MFVFGARSLGNLNGIHPDLRKVMDRAIQITPIDFTVIDGLRTKQEQERLVATGKSKTMRSRHLTGHAVDIAPIVDGKISWDWPVYLKLSMVVKKAAADVGVKIEWGGDWTKFRDGPHWQLPWDVYPK